MTDYEAMTIRQQEVWWRGDFTEVGSRAPVMHAEQLCEALDVHAGERVLDVAAGNGAAALAAARRFCDVTASDYVPELLADARRRAMAEGVELTTRVADCQALPFDNDSFDVVTSTFGAMFAPDQRRTADELLRVCRPGGRIGLCNWVPNSMIGDMLRAAYAHVPPPAGSRRPVEWGSESRLRELFGDRISSLRLHPRQFVWRYRSPDHILEYMRTWYGPMLSTFAALDDTGREALSEDLRTIFRKYNRSGDDTLDAPSDYVEVVAVKA